MTGRADGFSLLQQPDMERRLADMISLGTIAATDYSKKNKPRVRVKIGKRTTGWLPFTTGSAGGNGEWNPLEQGEQVVLACPSGDLAQAIVIARVNSNNAEAPDDNPDVTARTWKDGAREEYNRETHTKKIAIPAGGAVEFSVGGNKLLLNDAGLTVTVGGMTYALTANGADFTGGKVTIGSDLDVQGNVAAQGDVTAGSISLKDHVHSGVLPGGANTQKPVGG